MIIASIKWNFGSAKGAIRQIIILFLDYKSLRETFGVNISSLILKLKFLFSENTRFSLSLGRKVKWYVEFRSKKLIDVLKTCGNHRINLEKINAALLHITYWRGPWGKDYRRFEVEPFRHTFNILIFYFFIIIRN